MESTLVTEDLRRVVGEHRALSSGAATGPHLIVTGGIHGNEPSGIAAAKRVLAALDRRRPALRGRFTVVSGNLAALRLGVRYVERDLNRMWSEADLEGARAAGEDAAWERREARELDRCFRELLREPAERVVLLDLHSTSGDGPPWAVMGDTLQNREIAFALGIPVILGLEENVDGTLLAYWGERGHVAIGLEGGQHDAPSTVDNHESAIWLALAAAGVIAERDVPDLHLHRQRLRDAVEGLPAVVELLHRHCIAPDEEFRMEPGFANFAPVRKGDLLARTLRDGESEVRSPYEGLLLLPRYQGQGSDGFFIGRSVRPFWLRLSARLRRMGGERFLSWLPGVKLSPREPDVLEVDLRVARFLAPEIFHLFGYRKRGATEGRLTFSRRVEGPRDRRPAA